jgi:hypothetical protein
MQTSGFLDGSISFHVAYYPSSHAGRPPSLNRGLCSWLWAWSTSIEWSLPFSLLLILAVDSLSSGAIFMKRGEVVHDAIQETTRHVCWVFSSVNSECSSSYQEGPSATTRLGFLYITTRVQGGCAYWKNLNPDSDNKPFPILHVIDPGWS